MFRVTRKQLIRQGGNVIEFEDSVQTASRRVADSIATRILTMEIRAGYEWYGPDKVIFESPTFYRSVTVTIEEIK